MRLTEEDEERCPSHLEKKRKSLLVEGGSFDMGFTTRAHVILLFERTAVYHGARLEGSPKRRVEVAWAWGVQ